MAEDGPITVASAVVVPEGSPEHNGKRRTSSATLDGSKRPRLDNSTAEAATGTDGGGDNDQAQAVGGDEASTTRKRKLLGDVEVREQERKRGQRLFGALLGTIGKFQQDSQSARARAGANRRKEVEEKLQQKLRQQNEELDEKKRRESNILREKMQQEQKIFEERSLELRHANLRARANYLCTKAKPPLYYLPWKLTSEEKARIREQLDDAEALIRRERSEFDRQRAREDENEGRHRESQANESTTSTTATTNTDHPNPAPSSPDFKHQRGVTGGDRDNGPDTIMPDNDDDDDSIRETPVNPSSVGHENTNVSAPPPPPATGRDNERRRSDVTSHDGGDIVIEAGEDTVIY